MKEEGRRKKEEGRRKREEVISKKNQEEIGRIPLHLVLGTLEY
jgi:hypothetical protein